jgi:acetyl esterase
MSRRVTVDPYVLAVERRRAPLRRPEPDDPTARRRQAFEQDVAVAAAFGRTPLAVATREYAVPVERHPDTRLRVYWPDTEPTPGTALPALVYFYGGGFTLGSIDWPGWDATYRQRAHDAGVVVVAGEYGLAPEVRFPAQPEQCWTVLEWTFAHAAEVGIDTGRVAVGGASSGGNLAAATALMNRDRSDHPLRLQLLECPSLDLTMGHVDLRGMTSAIPSAILRREGRRLVRDYLGPDRRTRRHPYASPLLAPSLVGLPPAVVYTSEADTLRGDGEAWVAALARAGVPAVGVRYIGQTHTSGGFAGEVPAADHLHRDVVRVLRTLHDDPVTYPDPRTI